MIIIYIHTHKVYHITNSKSTLFENKFPNSLLFSKLNSFYCAHCTIKAKKDGESQDSPSEFLFSCVFACDLFPNRIQGYVGRNGPSA